MVELCRPAIRIKKHTEVTCNLGSSKSSTIIDVDVGIEYYFPNHLSLFEIIHYMYMFCLQMHKRETLHQKQ